MKTFGLVLLLMLMVCTAGCNRRARSKSGPLTVEAWEMMPAEEKYTVQAMERLKQGDPKFQNDTEWDHFARHVFIPARDKNFPNGMPKK